MLWRRARIILAAFNSRVTMMAMAAFEGTVFACSTMFAMRMQTQYVKSGVPHNGNKAVNTQKRYWRKPLHGDQIAKSWCIWILNPNPGSFLSPEFPIYYRILRVIAKKKPPISGLHTCIRIFCRSFYPPLLQMPPHNLLSGFSGLLKISWHDSCTNLILNKTVVSQCARNFKSASCCIMLNL